MPVTSSGVISIQDLMTELGVSGQTSMNDEDIRGLIGKASGTQMSLSEWYGASSGFSFTVNADVQEASVSTLATAAGWNGSDAINMTVASGKYLWSDDVATPGLLVDTANTTVINNGYIIGRGGNGGNYNVTGWDGNNYSGHDGGPGLTLTQGGCTIQNNSGAYIAGGGGGGYGGRARGAGGAGGGIGHTIGGTIGQPSPAGIIYGWIGTPGSLYQPSWAIAAGGAGAGGGGGAIQLKYVSGKYKKMLGGHSTGGGRVLTGSGGTGAYFNTPNVGSTYVTYWSNISIMYIAGTFPSQYAMAGGSAGNVPPVPSDPGSASWSYSGYAAGGGWGANGGAFYRYDGVLIHGGDASNASSGRGGAAISGTARTVINNGTIYGAT